MLLGVSVLDKKEFAYKEYEILCADMLGTISNPYLIGTHEDLQSIGLTPEQSVAKYGAESKNLHKKWITQINTEEEVIQETANPQIHFKFMADVNMEVELEDETKVRYGHTISALNYEVEGIVPDKIVEGVENNFTYQGLDINGFGFKLQKFSVRHDAQKNSIYSSAGVTAHLCIIPCHRPRSAQVRPFHQPAH